MGRHIARSGPYLTPGPGRINLLSQPFSRPLGTAPVGIPFEWAQMAFPNPPQKIVPFNSGPVPPHNIGRQFDEQARSIRTIIEFIQSAFRDDGALKNHVIGPEQLSPDIVQDIAQRALDEVEGLLQQVKTARTETLVALADTRKIQLELRDTLMVVARAVRDMDAMKTQAVAKFDKRLAELAVIPPWEPPPSPGIGVLGPPYSSTTSGIPAFFGVDQWAATGTALDYAQVSMEWAEHMPDTIPPNILAVNGITGDHWSSRWWANRAGSFFGGATAWMYLGPFPSTNAPSQTPTGEPLQVGMLYYATDLSQGMVWNGGAWQPLGKPVPAVTSALFYKATANQTVFPLTTADLFGNTFTLQVGQGVAVYLNGVRLTPDDGSGTKGDYVVSIPTSTVTLGAGAPVNTIVTLDALTLPSQLAPSVAKIHKLKPLTPAFDGTTTVFTMQSVDGATVNVSASEQIMYSLDGVWQEPITAFTAAGATLTFVAAPTADAYGFGVWASPL